MIRVAQFGKDERATSQYPSLSVSREKTVVGEYLNTWIGTLNICLGISSFNF